MAILAAGFGLPAKTACEPWKSERVKKEFTKPQAEKACGFFYLKKKNLN
ncbi:MAG: hypothetical protein VX409_00420 [Verrucomicrobiota bacterium]|nr:hypothetical protein [Verrucomicrobiota bacterium]